MSSYLNFYIRKKDEEPIRFASFSRSSNIYQNIYEHCNPTWETDADGNIRYSELSVNDINYIIQDINNNIDTTRRRLEALKHYANGNIEIIHEILEIEDYIEDLIGQKEELWVFINIIETLSYNEDSKLVCNID